MASSCTNRYVLVKYKHVFDVYVYRTAKKKKNLCFNCWSMFNASFECCCRCRCCHDSPVISATCYYDNDSDGDGDENEVAIHEYRMYETIALGMFITTHSRYRHCFFFFMLKRKLNKDSTMVGARIK